MAEDGTGQRTNYIKMVAEVLQLPPERVSIAPPDSLVTPYEFGPVGSRGTCAIGSAVIRAAEEARWKFFEILAPKLGVRPEDLATENAVEVGTVTGEVSLLKVVNATDVGQVIDPQGLEGQLNGCLGSAGIDSALF